jgi:hypothetical protein
MPVSIFKDFYNKFYLSYNTNLDQETLKSFNDTVSSLAKKISASDPREIRDLKVKVLKNFYSQNKLSLLDRRVHLCIRELFLKDNSSKTHIPDQLDDRFKSEIKKCLMEEYSARLVQINPNEPIEPENFEDLLDLVERNTCALLTPERIPMEPFPEITAANIQDKKDAYIQEVNNLFARKEEEASLGDKEKEQLGIKRQQFKKLHMWLQHEDIKKLAEQIDAMVASPKLTKQELAHLLTIEYPMIIKDIYSRETGEALGADDKADMTTALFLLQKNDHFVPYVHMLSESEASKSFPNLWANCTNHLFGAYALNIEPKDLYEQTN